MSATGLLLTGGGARAAYQVGVLEAIADLRREAGAIDQPNPFPIITGTSAGAINAAALACGADDFDGTVRRIADVWQGFSTGQVYRADALGMLDAMGRMRLLLGVGQLLARWLRMRPRSLLDNGPLAALLQRLVPLDRLPGLMAAGHVQALAVTASSYSSGEHFTFFDSALPMEPWVRSQRIAVAGSITHDHLMASSAIPFVFPATALPIHGHTEYFGDGSMRQSAPISPAIHLGAERILVIGAGRLHEPPADPGPNTMTGYPTLAQIAGHAMSSIFLDALAADIERLRRINQTLTLIPPELRAQSRLRPVELLVIAPSERIDVIAARHVGVLPGAVRRLFGVRAGLSGTDIKGSALASYLLFDTAFTRELMALGRADALRQRAEVMRFFGWARPSA
ncbi:patatin-like phospholipase family protein [Variovorax sp. J22G21]|uniref:patatin-like phospholipase family protein n=1 Tax=Variovorax fucosicus TaxID=3053517 RepID=UPI002577A9CF|nr:MULTISPECIES: patatin-like phospholipase family protein [unclassified Variovorax]MDM0038067.1 patatin-like phospholipase family protein [Variovorax sp. J22R193]MDM0062843.1 patatin-like phospholipase family protein [Variovorax sp. J22G21]